MLANVIIFNLFVIFYKQISQTFFIEFYSRFKQIHPIISFKFPIFGRFYKLYSKQTHNIHVQPI